MNRLPILYIVSLLFCSTILTGCLKDKITPPVEVSLNETAQLLFYLEDSGDYINSDKAPSLVDVDEVFLNIQNYLLLDIRPSQNFTNGHIAGAINKSHSVLISFLDSIGYNNYSKIILISNNGQSSAFYTCLLRLYGFENTYSMSYGMAAWNNAFSNEWLSALQQNNEFLDEFTNYFVPLPQYSTLPEVSLSQSSVGESAKQRIKDLMQIDYNDNLGDGENTATIDYVSLMSTSGNYFIVCYDAGLLYNDRAEGLKHPQSSVLLHSYPGVDLSSSKFLQVLPPHRKIILYSTNGELSAFAVAYLRVLGYDAKSVLFGANNMFYNILSNINPINEDAFSQDKIKDYPIVTGN